MKRLIIEYKTKSDVRRSKEVYAVNLIAYSKLLISKGCHQLSILK